MALSDYLTEDEWDGCYYVFLGQQKASLVEIIKQIVPALYENGYIVQGMLQDCTPVKSPTGNNARKVMAAMGNETKIYLQAVPNNGRNFIKQHLPELIKETDEEWEAWLKETEPEVQPQTTPNDKPRKRSKA